MIQTKLTDAGRGAAGYYKEHNDCAVRSWAIAKDIPYHDSHLQWQEAGRRNAGCVYNKHIAKVVGIVNLTNVTLTKFLAEHSKGVFWVYTRTHAFTIKDQVVYDEWPMKTGKCKIRGWKEII